MSDARLDAEQLRSAALQVRQTLSELQYLQRKYDEVGWRVSEPPWRKARHVLLHLTAVSAEIAAVIEQLEHAEDDGTPPAELDERFSELMARPTRLAADLVMHGLQLATLLDRDIGELIIARYRGNAARFAPGSVFEQVLTEVGESSEEP